MSLGGQRVGLANKKEDHDKNNVVEQRGASIDATLEPSEEKGKVSEIIAKNIGVLLPRTREARRLLKKVLETKKIVSEKIVSG